MKQGTFIPVEAQQAVQPEPDTATSEADDAQDRIRKVRRWPKALVACLNAQNDHGKALASKLTREWFDCSCDEFLAGKADKWN